MIFMQSIQSVLTIILIISLGYFLKKYSWIDDKFGKSISLIITKIALPSAIFVGVLKHLTRESLFQLSGSLIYPIGTVILSYFIAYILVKILKIKPGRRGIFMNAIANANTIFIGLPLNIALFGTISLPFFLVCYISNTISTWAFGVFLINNDDPTKIKGKNNIINWKKVFPLPLVGFFIGIIFLLMKIPVPHFISATLGYVGSLVTPLSLIYIGTILYNAGLTSIKFDRDTLFALLGRFILSPLLMIGLLVLIPEGHDLPILLRQTFVVQSGTPMLAVLPILANEAHGDVRYATNLVTTSTILFVIVIPILMQIIQYI